MIPDARTVKPAININYLFFDIYKSSFLKNEFIEYYIQ